MTSVDQPSGKPPRKAPEILIVEDESSILEGLCDLLVYHGYQPTGASTGEQGLELGRKHSYSMAILDVMLPGVSGLEICRELRSTWPDLPILMLTARGSEDDVVEGLRSGADDYVTKPFSVRELMARVEALLRRAVREAPATEVFAFGPWQVDHGALSACSADETIELTLRETRLLALFAREVGRVVSRRTLLTEIWDLHNVDEIETRTVDVHIAKLRKKIDRTNESLIQTVRGVGYRPVPVPSPVPLRDGDDGS